MRSIPQMTADRRRERYQARMVSINRNLLCVALAMAGLALSLHVLTKAVGQFCYDDVYYGQGVDVD